MSMAREQTYTSIIIKKQPYEEADEIVTLFTREAGKLRGLAKSSKLPKSKLQYALQPLFICETRLAGRGGLAKIIGVKIATTFPRIAADVRRMELWFVAAELFLKAMPDEQPNEGLFDLYQQWLYTLDSTISHDALELALAKFKIVFADSMGFGIHRPDSAAMNYRFSNSQGGFVSGVTDVSAVPVPELVVKQFIALDQVDLSSVDSLTLGSIEPLQELLSSFLRYQLERDIKSEQYLKASRANMV